MADIVEVLRSRFGTALKEAKGLIRNLQQGKMAYHQLGDDVTRLIDLVYGECELKKTLKVEQFALTLNNVKLKSFSI